MRFSARRCVLPYITKEKDSTVNKNNLKYL